jgi:beta-1,4-mannosyltransferase
MTALVTVVIPAWDEVPHLAAAVDSVRAQDVPAHILVFDNASQLQLPPVAVDQIARSSTRLTIGGARATSLRSVQTEYVLFLDADDWLAPGGLKALLDAVREARADVAIGRIRNLTTPSDSRGTRGLPRRGMPFLSKSSRLVLLAESARHGVPVTGATLMRTSFARGLRYPDLAWGEDWATAVAMLAATRPVFVPRTVKLHRTNAPGSSLVSATLTDATLKSKAEDEVMARLAASGQFGTRTLRMIRWTHRARSTASAKRGGAERRSNSLAFPTIASWPAERNRAHNPFQHLLTAALRQRGAAVQEFRPLRDTIRRYDAWLWHWPDMQFNHVGRLSALGRLSTLICLMTIAKVRGTKLLWTAHNLNSHETSHPWLERLFWAVFTRRLDGVLYLSEESHRHAVARHPALTQTPAAHSPHGHYIDEYPRVHRDIARHELGIPLDRKVLLTFGKLRAYKGTEDLTEAFAAARLSNTTLLVAGEIDDQLAMGLGAAKNSGHDIRVMAGRLAPHELGAAIAAADLIVLPYRRVLNSGSAVLALSLGRPVLVPHVGSLPELQGLVTSDWVMTYEGELHADVLTKAATWAVGPKPELDVSALDWHAMADELLRLLTSLKR